MGLFDKLKSLVSDDKKDTGTIEIVAPLSGEIVNIEDVPDVVFAEKIVGDGIAIKPTGNKMVAPVDGTIGKIFETNHAFSIESDSGIELFVHFGIDTVELKGEGFKRIAEEGQRVKVGDPVIEFDVLRFYKCILIDRKLGNIFFDFCLCHFVIPSLLLQIFFQKSKYHIPVRLEHAPSGSKQFMLCARYFYHFCHTGTAFCHFPDHPLLGTVGHKMIVLRLK